ncbi:TolC family protein [Chondrinema litorale]|uniref:TolC family protein n=1 Tax=Chondrinema litorale TaxID=2994555 RepID=UPI0025439FD6|nr:TolC family protein [Chondrinema litorale]UZR93715.1 TolC family protein [Chondrinema litorale]
MKKSCFYITGILMAVQLFTLLQSANAQDTLSLQRCYQLMEELHPEEQSRIYAENIRQLKQENLSTAFLPQFAVNGQATYQSDVMSIPIESPAFSIPDIPKDQYKIQLEVSQLIYDGGVNKIKKTQEELNEKTTKTEINLNQRQVKSQINSLFFTALNLQEQERLLNESVLGELQNQLKLTEARIKNGVLLKGAANSIQIEILKIKQDLLNVNEQQKAVFKMLKSWTGLDNLQEYDLLYPSYDIANNSNTNFDSKPQIQILSLQQQQLEVSKDMIQAGNMPMLSAFANAGFGSPNPYNMFETSFEPFYLLGLRLNWQPFKYGNTHRSVEVSKLQQSALEARKESINKQSDVNLIQYQQDAERLQKLIETDQEMIVLQEDNVKEYGSLQQNGVITSTGYLTEVNKLTQFQLNLQIHKMSLAKAKVDWMFEAGILK